MEIMPLSNRSSRLYTATTSQVSMHVISAGTSFRREHHYTRGAFCARYMYAFECFYAQLILNVYVHYCHAQDTWICEISLRYRTYTSTRSFFAVDTFHFLSAMPAVALGPSKALDHSNAYISGSTEEGGLGYSSSTVTQNVMLLAVVLPSGEARIYARSMTEFALGTTSAVGMQWPLFARRHHERWWQRVLWHHRARVPKTSSCFCCY